MTTLSDNDPKITKALVEHALSQAVNDGKVGNLETEPDSVGVRMPGNGTGLTDVLLDQPNTCTI